MGRRRARLRLWHLMALVAVAGLISSGYVWLLPPERTSSLSTVIVLHDVHVTVHIAGYDIPHTSPAFWVVLCLELVVLAGSIAVIVRTLRAVRRRITRTSGTKRSSRS